MIFLLSSSPWALGLICATAALVASILLSGIGRRPKGYPPGPPTLPLIGNLHLMPKSQPHIAFQRWADEYGPVFSLILGSQVLIVLSSDTAVKDLLDKRSAIYSSRPALYTANLAKNGQEFSLMPYGPAWRTIRRSVHSMVNVSAAKSYIPYQDLENKQMLVDLLNLPTDFASQLERYTDSVTTQMIFGYRSVTKDAPHIQEFYGNLHEFSEIMASFTGSLVDVFPALRYLPVFLLPAIQFAKAFYHKESRILLRNWNLVKSQIQAGTAKPCIAEHMLKAQKAEGMSDELVAYSLGVVHSGGADTSAISLRAFIQAMVLYPEVQLKARAELDRVCGARRLPEMDDMAKLPYIRASVKETLRWFSILPSGVPHAVTQDDEYRGYKIPKGASVLVDIYALNHDPQRYMNPRVFDPSRYLGDESTAAESAAKTDATKRDHFAFGAGRRICPGMHIAERTLLLSISRLLWGFEFSKATREVLIKDLAGQPEAKRLDTVVEITPDQDDLVEGLLNFPAPFPAKIVPRSPEHAAVMREAWADCQQLLDDEGQWKAVPEGMFKSSYTANADLGY